MGKNARKLAEIEAKEELARRAEAAKKQKQEQRRAKQEAFHQKYLENARAYEALTPEQKKEKNQKTLIGLGAIAAIVLLIIVFASAGGDNTPAPASSPSTTAEETVQTEQEPKASYTATITAYSPVDPASLRFAANVVNTGNAAGAPDCYVRAESATGTYIGYDVFGVDEIAPGENKGFTGVITITNEGSYYVGEPTISCT